MPAAALAVGVADLLRRAGNRRAEHLEAVLGELVVSGTTVPDGVPVVLDLELQSVNEGIVATGTVSTSWTGECRRCLRAITGQLEAEVTEIFEDHPVDGETRPLETDRIDLEPLARETVLLELPLAPLCRDDCAGLCADCGADLNVGDCGHGRAAADARWAALDQLRFDD